MDTAQKVEGNFLQVTAELHDTLVTDCDHQDVFKRLPKVIEFKGYQFGLTGWNSDRNVAYYKIWAVALYAKAV